MITNGSELNAAETVVSDNPTYLQGDYNNVNKKGAAVIADAITILSNRWGDVNGDGDTADPGDGDLEYSELTMNDRDASSTTVNAATGASTPISSTRPTFPPARRTCIPFV